MKEIVKRETEFRAMAEKDFIKKGKELVSEYCNYSSDFMQRVYPEDVYCVWLCKILQNNKGLFATNRPDGLYFEITYDGDNNKIYFDCYSKRENKVINM